MNNPYLDDFYKDMKTWGFHSQLYFLTHKFKLHMALNTRATTVVTVSAIGEIRVTEQCWGPEGKKEGARHFCWQRSA